MKFTFLSFFVLFFLQISAFAQDSFLKVRFQNGEYLMDVSSKYMGRDILVSNTILEGSARKVRAWDMQFGYGGDAVFSEMVRFKKEGDDIQLLNPQVIARSLTPSIFDKYNQTRIAPILAVFPIKSEKDGVYTIDITNFLNQDNPLVSLSGAKTELKLGGYDPSKSYIKDVKSYPENVNFRSYRSYMAEGSPESSEPTTWLVGSSWFLLPEKPMIPRIMDSRVGYFPNSMDGNLQRKNVEENVSFAKHWRLEPRPEDMEKYRKGELVEPQKQIVFYIDRATPSFLVPYFIKAVEKWEPVFEKAGFKNAITAKLEPTPQEDSTFSEDDIRYSIISYKASPIPNAYGPNVVDPRSGEIINSHVAIFHSVLELLQRWYFVMCSAIEPNARQYPLSQEVMGELASCVVTHEVGHTLGLRHNFAGSTAYSADSLRNVNFVRKNGIGASIMDYERFDFLAQPGDGFTLPDLLNKIGVYDDFAIEWGYRYFPDIDDPNKIADYLDKWVDKKRNQDRRLFFLTETDYSDPRVQAEDCGSDQIVANLLCIKNLKIVMSNIEKWNPVHDENYYVLRKRYLSVLSHYENLMNQVLKFIGGSYIDTPSRIESKQVLFSPVPAADQYRALDFLCDNILSDPKWLFPEDIMNKTNVDFETYVKRPYTVFLAKLMLKNVSLSKTSLYSENPFTTRELYAKLFATLFTSKESVKKLSLFERTMQSIFVTNLITYAENPANFKDGSAALNKEYINSVKSYLQKVNRHDLDEIDAAHYISLQNFISIWETGSQKSLLTSNAL